MSSGVERRSRRVASAPVDGGPQHPREPQPGSRRDRRRREAARIDVEARDQAAGSTDSGDDSSLMVDGTMLAQQRALAERAVTLTARARRMQELPERHQPQLGRRAPDDPASIDNLSIAVTPVDRPAPAQAATVLLAPTTSSVPVVVPGPEVLPDLSSRSAPIEARSAFGLEPLDVRTARLARPGRLRVLQYSLVGVGGAALLTGIMVTVSSLNG